MPKRVAIFHPSVAPFVQQAARAFYEAELLEWFYTTLRYDEQSIVQKLACAAAAAAGKNLRAQLQRRRVTEIPAAKVKSFPTSELMRLVAGRLDSSGRMGDVAWERSEKRFASKIAAEIHGNLSAVYGYEFGSLAVFRKARQLGVKTIYDVPAPEPTFVENLLREEAERFPELKTDYTAHVASREERRTAHRKAEWDLADVVIAASEFTRSSFAASGRDVSKLRIVPYGAPPPAAKADALAVRRAPGLARFVWAGTFSVRKGAHYLAEAWRKSELSQIATLDVFGSVTLPDRLIFPRPNGMNFRGAVSRDELLNAFRGADALVFPTLCDGFGMVVTEAWSQGLPVITTERAGAADLLRPGENGLLVPPGDAGALGNQLLELARNPQILHSMREASLATAAAWQWADYRRALITTLLPDVRSP